MNKPNSVPLFIGGPTHSRFYFISGDHWEVRCGQKDSIVSLQQRTYPWYYPWLPFLLIPGVIVCAGAVLYWFTELPEALWGCLAAACAAGIPMFYILRTERNQLAKSPLEAFALLSKDSVEVQGKTYRIDSIDDLTLMYTFFPPIGDQGYSGCSELDIVIFDGSQEQRINLLSQTSNWAWKHARKLHEISGIKLKQKTIYNK